MGKISSQEKFVVQMVRRFVLAKRFIRYLWPEILSKLVYYYKLHSQSSDACFLRILNLKSERDDADDAEDDVDAMNQRSCCILFFQLRQKRKTTCIHMEMDFAMLENPGASMNINSQRKETLTTRYKLLWWITPIILRRFTSPLQTGHGRIRPLSQTQPRVTSIQS